MRRIGYILVALGASPWVPLRLAHPDMADARMAITFWPLLLVTVISMGVGAYLVRRHPR